jgi:hypothetical protein
MDMQFGLAARTCSMDTQHRHAAWICSMDMKHRNSERTCNGWTCSMEKKQGLAYTLLKTLAFLLAE